MAAPDLLLKTMSNPNLPPRVTNINHLEELLSEPTEAVIQVMAEISGDIVFLGVGGKMGPTLIRMAKRASNLAGVERRIIGVSRFGSTPQLREQLHDQGMETIACDLLNPEQLQELPDVPNVVYLTGMKFGSTGQQARTWAMNCLLPGMVCQKYRNSKIVMFSTGNVYPFSPISHGGSVESDEPNPHGEYAMSCLGRERIAESCSRDYEIPMSLIRLNYAVEMRYGVLVDLAQQVWNEQPIDVSMGAFNVIWQGDANAMSLATFGHLSVSPFVINVTGPELLSVRGVAKKLGEMMDKEPRLEGEEVGNALISNSQKCHRLFGYPRVGVEQMLEWIVDWVRREEPTLNKPTHFEVRDGKY